MKSPTDRDIKRLFALSCNRCAYPNCQITIVQSSGTITGEICHIKANSSNWPRYDPKQSDEERHAFANLILLCSIHHKIVDSEPNKYTVELLKDFKEMHERNGNIELTQDDACLVRKLIDSYLQMQATDEAQVMVNSTAGIQSKHITVKGNKKSISRKTVKQTVVGDGNVFAGGDMIHTEKIVQKNVTLPGPQHITEEQAYEVKLLIDELSQIDVDAGREDSHRMWFSWLYRKFKVTSYKTIPSEKFEAVISWLRQQKAINRKKLRRPANALWRDQLYGAIYGRWRQLGFQKDEIYEFAFQRLELDKPIGSLKELGEQNLKRLYDIVIRIKLNQ
jgi:hypothetical protein